MTKSLKLFLFLQESYQTIGFYPPQSGSIPFNWKNAFMLLSILQLFLSTSAFFLFEANLIFEYGTSFYASITTLVSLVVLVIKLWKIADILTLIEKFNRFIEKRGHNTIAMAMYNEFNTNIEWLSKIVHVLLVEILFPAAMVSPLILTLVNYFIFDLKNESFYLPFPVMMPFDWKTPFGYLIALLVQATAFYCTVLGCGPLMCFLIGPCGLFWYFAKDIAEDFRLLDVNDEMNENERKIKIKKDFCNAVQLFANAKQLVNDFNHIYEFIATAFFVWTLLAMASALLVMQKELTQADLNPIELVFQLFLAVWSLVFATLFCELGEMTSKHFDKVDQQLFECNWYKFPIEVQRMLVIVTANSQQSVTIRGYGNILCTRDTLNKTTKCGFSYFMMLRHIDG